MGLVLLFCVIAAVVLVIILVNRKRKKPEDDIPLYVCPECGEHHCNCYLKEDVDRGKKK